MLKSFKPYKKRTYMDISKYLVVYEHERLVFTGLSGVIDEDLSITIPKIKELYPDAELSDVVKQPRRDFIASFLYNPSRDITFDRCGPCENGLVGMALNKSNLVRTIERILPVIGFTPTETDAANKLEWGLNFEIEKQGYKTCKIISGLKRIPLDRVFGVMRYANLLNKYRGMDEASAIDVATKKLGVRLS